MSTGYGQARGLISTVPKSVHSIDPLKDPRWDSFLLRHPRASIFHSKPWLQSLHRTYGYETIAFTTSPADGDLRDAVVFCLVKDWFQGSRLVSLPFSDHAEPLFDSQSDLCNLLQYLEQGQAQGKWKRIELRPAAQQQLLPEWDNFQDGPTYAFHSLDLRPNLSQLFDQLHKDSIQRKINRAAREGLIYEEGRSMELLDQFYKLTLLTRRRQALPPPPFAWFRNLLDCAGELAKVRLVSKEGKPAAAILTLFHKQTLTYKYGASDAHMHNLGGMPFLLWKAIEDGKKNGANNLDLGRSDVSNSGLVRFKNRFGSVQSTLTYKRFPVRKNETGPGSEEWQLRLAKRIFATLPDRMLVLAGRLLYPHFG